MARKSFLDQMMEIRMADEAKQTLATFQEINNQSRNAPNNESPSDRASGVPSERTSPATSPVTIQGAAPGADLVRNERPDETPPHITNDIANQTTNLGADSWPNQRADEGHSERIIERTNEKTNIESIDGRNEGISERTSHFDNERPNPGTNERTGAWPNHGVDEELHERVTQSRDARTIEGAGQRSTEAAQGLTQGLTEDQAEELTSLRAKTEAPPITNDVAKPVTDAIALAIAKSRTEPKQLRVLTADCRRLLRFFIENNPVTLSYLDLCDLLKIKYPTLRKYTKTLEVLGFISKHRVCEGAFQGTCFVADEKMCDFVKPHLCENRRSCGPKEERTSGRSLELSQERSSDLTKGLAKERTGLLLDRKIKENLSIYEDLEEEAKKLYQTDDEDMQMFLPDLYQAGFTSANVRSLVERRHKNGLDMSDATVKMIRMGLRHADAALRIGGGSLNGFVNTVVKDNVSYIFTALFKDASFRKPPGWEPEEVVAQQLEMDRLRQEAERQRLEEEIRDRAETKAKTEREEHSYKAWRSALTPEEIAAFKERCPNKKSEESLERFLRNEWRKTLG